jgi:hypothetical protein
MTEQATAEMASEATGRRRRVDRWFYIGVGLFVILLSVVGFGPSIIDESRRNAPPTPMAIAHGIVAGSWLLLFLTQSSLVATRRIAVHRRLGMVGPVLAIALIVLGCLVTVGEVRRGYDLSGDVTRALARPGSLLPAPAGLLFSLAGFLDFGVLVAAGLWYRHRPDIHKRLMLLAMVPLASEPFLHLGGHLIVYWPNFQGAGTFIPRMTPLLLSVSAIHDWVTQRRIHPVSLWVPILLFAWLTALAVVVLPSAPWREFTAWLIP